MGTCIQRTVESVDASIIDVNEPILIQNEVKLNMMRLSKRLSITGQTKRAYLVSGYVREYSPNMFPIDIIQSCFIFYDDVYFWIIKDDDLQRFKQCEINESYPLGKFVYGDFKFKAKIYPNTHNKYSQFVLTLSSELNYIKCMIIYIEIYCQETQSHYKRTVKLNKIRPNKKRKVLETDNFFLFDGLNENDMNINNGLRFAVCIEILHCEYNDTLFIMNDVNMLNKVESEWNINYDILKFIKQKYSDWTHYNLYNWDNYDFSMKPHFIFYSDEFDKENKNWCIYIKPTTNEIGIALLRWPSFICTIKAVITFILSWTVQRRGFEKRKWSIKAIFNYDNQYRSETRIIPHVFGTQISKLNILSYKVYCKVVVTEIFDDQRINRNDTLIHVTECDEEQNDSMILV